MTAHATFLKSATTGERVAAVLQDDLPLDAMFEAEAQWAEQRVRIEQQFARQKAPLDELPESNHWRWSRKGLRLMARNMMPGPLGIVRILGIEADDQWQGLMLAHCEGYRTRIAPAGRELVYCEYLETAPWNWEVKAIAHVARYKGVGLQLMAAAVLWSQELEMKGRVGLHSLPQSEPFYRDRCNMTEVGKDPKPLDMVYFEMSEEQATAFLGKGGQ